MGGDAGRALSGALIVVFALSLTAAATTLTVRPAVAETPQLSTPYPSVSVDAGDRVALDLQVTADAPTPVALRVTEVPDGWQASLRGGGFLIGAVHATPEEPPEVELEVTVPLDAEEGEYTVVVEASGAGRTDVLDITLRLDEAATGEATLTAEFPSLRAPSGTPFTFDAVLDNAHPQERTFALSAAGPRGWQVEVMPSGQDAASTVTLEPGETTDLTVEASPPPGATAGTYPILVRASGGGETLDLELEAEITGTYELVLSSIDERLNLSASPGRAATFDLVVHNEGSAPLQEVEFRASSPSGWETEFAPEEIDVIEPGESAQARLTVTPAEDAIVGDYRLTVTASAPEVDDEVDVRVSVEASRAWGLVGAGLVVAALGGLGWVFRTFGRR